MRDFLFQATKGGEQRDFVCYGTTIEDAWARHGAPGWEWFRVWDDRGHLLAWR